MHHPFAPLSENAQPRPLPRPRPPAPGPRRVTHLAKKCLQMRHKISTHPHNPLKKRSLKRHE